MLYNDYKLPISIVVGIFIVVMSIYFYSFNKNTYSKMKKLSKANQNNKDIIYIDIYEDFQNNKDFRSRKQNIYPNRHGYQAISNKIIDKMAKRLEKQKNN